jgi:hypothetical protein
LRFSGNHGIMSSGPMSVAWMTGKGLLSIAASLLFLPLRVRNSVSARDGLRLLIASTVSSLSE